MRRIILGLGVALGTAMAVVAVVANAASGDAIYAKRDNERYSLPPGAKRAAVVALLTECYPGLGVGTFARLQCTRLAPAGPGLVSVSTDWRCAGEQFAAAVTDAARLDLVLTGTGQSFVSTDATVALPVCTPSRATMETLTQANFSVAQNVAAEFVAERQPLSIVGLVKIVSATPALWKADLDAQLVVGTIGKVQ